MRLLPPRLVLVVSAGLLAACSSSDLPAADAGPPDAGPAATVDAGMDPPPPCDLLDQSSCEAGDKCTIMGEGNERIVTCAELAGTRARGETCDPAAGAGDDCAAGLYCDDSTAPAVCVEFCSEDPDSCSAGSVCALQLSVADARLCADICDPVNQDCARSDFGCYPGRKGPSCAVIGGGETPVAEGEVCDYANECEPGLACLRVGQATEWTCLRVCDPFLVDDGCQAFQVCNQVDNETWGICITL